MDRNFILALAATALIFIGYDMLVVAPKREAYQEAQAAAQAEAQAAAELAVENGLAAPSSVDDLVSGVSQTETLSRDDALAQSTGRLEIETPQLKGSLNLRGLTFDDLVLTQYNETVEDDSPLITLLSPQASAEAQFVRSGIFIDRQPDDGIQWTAPTGAKLTPTSPVTLTRSNGELEHAVTLSVDEKFMFTVEHQVTNRTGDIVTVQPYGVTFQKGIPEGLENFMILFEGPLAVVNGQLREKKYKKLLNNGGVDETGTQGWVGITDKFWLSAVIPAESSTFRAKLDVRQNGATPLFRASYQQDPINVPSGEQVNITSYVYAGAKEVDVLRSYQKPVDKGGLGIQEFDRAVDWGNFFFLTRPIFNSLHFFNGIVGNYGIAILLLTLAIKAVLFPLANMSYKSMAGMRKAQPEMQRLKERYKDDQQKMQQEMMGIYKKHKINPAAGCLPILAQMPIFYALYKTLFVTIEMRHEPFLYIKDLSENDPTTIFNLFGLLPFDPTTFPVLGAFLGIGVLPLLMGAGMWVQMKLNPPPTDPMQAKIFAFMPLIFLFLFANFAAGLVLYWAWNTFLGVVQQYVIMKRNGVEVDLIGNIKTSLGLDKPKTANDNASGK